MRPTFHFTPQKNWINDPNGLVFLAGEYHLFYQHNPLGDTPGNIGWGHAVSTDLITWTELPMALPYTNGIMAFSGSAVVDTHNSSGFGADALVAIYTAHHTTRALQTQHLAFSTDLGRSWTLFEGNPVLDIKKTDFRDPKVFWHTSSHQWIMVVALPNERMVQFYGSSNLKSWRFLSDFGPAGSVDGIWEVPDVFELPFDGTSYWVLKVDVGFGALHGGSGGQYFIGHFDGQRFLTDSLETNWLDFGKDFYAALSFSNLEKRRIWLAWMNNWQYAQATPTTPWRGAMSLPRELSLFRDSSGLRLRQQPIPELEQRRGEVYTRHNWSIENQHLELPIRGEQLEILVEFDALKAIEFGLGVRIGVDSYTTIGYHLNSKQIFVDKTQSGAVFHPDFSGRHEAVFPLEQGVLRLHVFVDSCSLEVFVGSGELVFTELIFPEPNAEAIEVYAVGGSVELKSLAVWRL